MVPEVTQYAGHGVARATAQGQRVEDHSVQHRRPVVGVQKGAAGPANLRVRVARMVVLMVFRLLFRLRVSGLDNVQGGPVIVCANHLGWADAFLILLMLPVEPRLYVLGDRAAVLRNSFRTRMIDSLQIMVPLERAQPREALRTMEDVLHRGGSLIVFPEGHLGPEEGALQPLQPGAAHLSVRSGIPIVPVGLTGTRELWLRRTLTVQVGRPIDPATFTAGSVRSRAASMTVALEGELRRLLPGDGERARHKLLRDWLTGLF